MTVGGTGATPLKEGERFYNILRCNFFSEEKFMIM